MRKFILAAVIIVAAGIAASIYLLSDNKNNPAPQAMAVNGAPAPAMAAIDFSTVDVEAEYNAGKRSLPLISALADKRVAAGDRAGAIKVLEEYVAANPKDGQGHKKLAEQYQLAGRQDDYNRELVALANADPTEANLRILSDVYNANKDYVKQAEVLRRIVDVTQGKNPQAFVDLATIQLVINDKDGALKTIDELKAKHPTFTSYPLTRVLVTILAEKNETEQAFKVAKDWINSPVAPLTASPNPAPNAPLANTADSDPRPHELADLCNILHYSGHADKAIALVEPHLEMLERSTELVVAYVNADVTAGRADHAYALLQKIDEAQRMTPALYPIYIELAIKREDMPAAETIANKLDVKAFNEEQALNILETVRANNAPSVHKILISRFDTQPVLEGKPVLAAVLSILKNEKTQDQKIEVALNTELSSVQRIRLAEACARAQKTPCFDAIVKQFPAIPQMTPSQVLEYAQLYIIANRPTDIITPVGERAVQQNAHADIQTGHRRLAAAAGRLDILKPWLEGNANTAPIGSVQELYYIANDHHQIAVASDVAERLYARDPSPSNRLILVNALVAANNNERAVELLREQVRDNGANDGLYLTALSKLARKNATYRKELTDYAEAALRAQRGDARQQLNYAYILINNGRKDAVIPYAKTYAAQRGGEWKKMYAQLTQKPGKGGVAKLTREQRIEMAKSKTISEANKRQIAFSLLNDGHKADAAVIFQDLAQNKGPDSQEVKDLMYLWGGKLNPEQMQWVRTRAANASPYDKARWAELINNGSDDAGVIRYVSETPDALYNRPLRQKYFRILATSDNRANFDSAMRNWVAQTTDVPALVDYAATAQAHGYREAADNAYARVLTLDPNNAKALSQSAALQFSKGKYTEADKNLNQYMAVQAHRPDSETNPAEAHFYKAELLRRAGDKPAANAEFQQVVALTTASGSRAPDALSRLYTAQFHLGQHDAAKAGFNQLLAQHPDDKGILADYMSALIEYHYVSEASRVANQYDKTSPYYNKGVSLTGKSPNVAGVEQFSDGREIKISFSQPIEGQSPINLSDAQKLAWVESSSAGYDSVSISAKPGYVVRYVPTAQQQFQVVPAQAPGYAQNPGYTQAYTPYAPDLETKRQQDLRLQLLYARIEQDSGQADRAKQRVAVLKHYYPNDPQVITYEAGLASASGNNAQALSLLQQAQMVSPENEAIAQQLSNLRRANSGAYSTTDYVKLDQAYRGIGDNDEFITTLSGAVGVARQAELGFNLQNDILKTQNIRRGSDGRIGDYDMNRQRGEIFTAYNMDGGERLQGSLFFNNKTAGAGGYFDFNSPIGRLQLLGEYHRPYWDFVEAVVEHTNRDRIGVKNYATLTPTTSLGVEASLNKYNTDLVDDARKTTLVRVSVVEQLQAQTADQPYFGVGYGFDGEYKTGDAKSRLDTFGNEYYPFPLTNREIHSLTGIYQDDFNHKQTHVRLVGGVAFDRFTDATSPLVDGRIDHDLNSEWQIGARARYAMQTQNTDNDQLDLGVDVIHKF